jgi:hypothetical protein
VEGPVGVAPAQLVCAGAFTFGSYADQDAYRFAVPPLGWLTPPGEYIYYPVQAFTPDKGSGFEFFADMYGYWLIYIPGHLATPLL